MDHRTLSTILRHDAKVTSYKIALLRAMNAVVTTYPRLERDERDVAVPLRVLAEHWIAYYWPFVDPNAPVYQGPRATRDGRERQDLAFRAELEALRRAWEATHGGSSPADGFLLIDLMRVERKRRDLSPEITTRFRDARRKITTSLRQPIRYAGPGQHAIFAEPGRLREMAGVRPLPGATPNDACVRVPAGLWRAFRDMSLWIEALCVHEWSLFTERTDGATRGEAYRLLTAAPENRLPLTWERNRIDLRIAEGAEFRCPWTGNALQRGDYDLDHVIPVSVYPIHELWNLAPADADFNRTRKRDRLPGEVALERATPHLIATFTHYRDERELARALEKDVASRFGTPADPPRVAASLRDLVRTITRSRNLPTF